jgi:hypothetical protein
MLRPQRSAAYFANEDRILAIQLPAMKIAKDTINRLEIKCR